MEITQTAHDLLATQATPQGPRLNMRGLGFVLIEGRRLNARHLPLGLLVDRIGALGVRRSRESQLGWKVMMPYAPIPSVKNGEG